ncbi:MAG TPA: hypothetical protein VF481_11960 [Novosphingobium sp.]
MPDDADRSAIQASAASVRMGLREVAANLLRITRGSGRPELIVAQITALVGIFAAYREVAGEDLKPSDITEALRLEHIVDDEDELWPVWDRAVREMVNGALQVAAAELLGQQAQAATGRRELFAGYRHIEKLHSRQLIRLLQRRASESEE